MQGATVETLKEASRVVAIAQASVNDVQFVFPGRWVDWEHIGVLTLTDASFCNEKGYTAGTNPFHSGRKRKGASVYRVYPLAFNSTTIKRVRKATLQAETYSLQAGLEAGDRIRALLCEMKGGITVANQWDDQSKAGHWLTFCQQQRLGIELASIRQSVWIDCHGHNASGLRDKNQ